MSALAALRAKAGSAGPGVARLRAALDPRRVLDALRDGPCCPTAPGLRATGCRVDRLYPRGAKGFVIGYEIDLESDGTRRTERRFGELVPGDGEAHFRDAAFSLAKPRRSQLPMDDPGAGLAWLPDPGVVLRRPGLDERIDALRLLREPHVLLASLPAHGDLAERDGYAGRLLAHRLGKRCVARLSAGDGRPGASAIAKMFAARRDRARHAYRQMQMLVGAGFGPRAAVRIPRPLALAARWDTVLMEDVSGAPVCCLSRPDPAAGAAGAGRALAALHRAAIEPDRRHGVDDELAILDEWVRRVAQVYPRRAAAFDAAFSAVRGRLERCRAFTPVAVHRDFHEKQVAVRDDGSAVLMDFDTLCVSDAALDAGNFVAHLELAEIEGRIPDAAATTHAFEAGYGAPPDRGFADRVQAHRRATLLRLACLHAFAAHRAACVDRLLARAT